MWIFRKVLAKLRNWLRIVSDVLLLVGLLLILIVVGIVVGAMLLVYGLYWAMKAMNHSKKREREIYYKEIEEKNSKR